MTEARSYLLGFDLRACEADYVAAEWPPERRSTYLLRDDVRWPLSVDHSAWPSLFRLDRGDPVRFKKAIDVPPETVVQLGVGLWNDRAAMERLFGEKSSNGTCAVSIAVELWHDRALTGDPEWDFIASEIVTADEHVGRWTAMGYDIADRYLVSGLVNCGYTPEDRSRLSEWSERLNVYGLFDDLRAANEFRQLTDERVPEHAPFFAYRILADVKR